MAECDVCQKLTYEDVVICVSGTESAMMHPSCADEWS